MLGMYIREHWHAILNKFRCNSNTIYTETIQLVTEYQAPMQSLHFLTTNSKRYVGRKAYVHTSLSLTVEAAQCSCSDLLKAHQKTQVKLQPSSSTPPLYLVARVWQASPNAVHKRRCGWWHSPGEPHVWKKQLAAVQLHFCNCTQVGPLGTHQHAAEIVAHTATKCPHSRFKQHPLPRPKAMHTSDKGNAACFFREMYLHIRQFIQMNQKAVNRQNKTTHRSAFPVQTCQWHNPAQLPRAVMNHLQLLPAC